MGNIAFFDHQFENRRHRQCGRIEFNRHICRQDAGYIVVKTAAGDMGDTIEGETFIHRLTDGGVVADMGMQQSFTDGFSEGFHIALSGIFAAVEKDFTGKTESVGVRAIGSDTDGDMTGADLFAGDDFALFDDTGDHTDQIEVIAVHSGHFSGFTAENSASCSFTGFGDTAENFLIKR